MNPKEILEIFKPYIARLKNNQNIELIEKELNDKYGNSVKIMLLPEVGLAIDLDAFKLVSNKS